MRRLCAVGALVCGAAAVAVALAVLWSAWRELIVVAVAAVVASTAAWYVLSRRGAVRGLAATVAVVAVVGAVVVFAGDNNILGVAVVLLLALATGNLAELALAADTRSLQAQAPPGERAPRPQHPILLCNPRSGGGKANAAFVAAARERGIETVMLEPGTDLVALTHDAVARGADALGAAGGDGTQAVVAEIAARHDLPFVCIPAGTRNHFALDLGVDRDDVIGALDAFVDGYERRVDLARVNDRVFVNNVSFGVYAEIVQSAEYRDDKMGTAARMLPELLGPGYAPFDLELDGPPGVGRARPDLVLVSNNAYRLSGIGGLGTRARLDEGVLGVIVVEVSSAADLTQLVALEAAGAGARFSGWHEWTTPEVEIRSGTEVKAGIDGEAVTLEAPVRLESWPGALRVRIAPHHPGLSPAAVVGRVRAGGPGRLVRVALGREPEPGRADVAR